MKYLLFPLLAITVLVSLLLVTSMAPAAPPSFATDEVLPVDPPANNLVVLELFTSQGCSSCPSADALLQELGADREEVIALSFHVDYWNYLGWADPFSSPYYSARQTDYTDVLQERTYTPQLVINGQQALIGSRRQEVAQAIKSATQAPLSHNPTLNVTRGAKQVEVTFELAGDHAGKRVTALLVQPEATSAIKRGENRGRELHHVNVVRSMEHAPAAGKGTFRLTVPAELEAAATKVVLLVQDTRSQAIVGAVREK